MKSLFIVFLSFFTVAAIGCIKKGKESLEKYDNIITEEEILEIVSYSGIIERSINENTEKGVHLSFGTEGYLSRSSDGVSIFNIHIEYLFSDEKELVQDMKGRQAITGIGTHAWYNKASNGYNSLIFYLSYTNIIVEMGGHTEGSGHDPSTFIEEDGLIQLSQLVESRL